MNMCCSFLLAIPILLAPTGANGQGGGFGGGPGNNPSPGGPPTDPPTPLPSSPPTRSPTSTPTTAPIKPTNSPTQFPTVSITSCEVIASIDAKVCLEPCCIVDASGTNYQWPYTKQATILDIRYHDVVTSLDFPLLDQTGEFRISYNENLIGISAPNLSIASTVVVSNNPMLLGLSLLSLEDVLNDDGGEADFVVQSNEVLAFIHVPKLRSIRATCPDSCNGNLQIELCPSLLNVQFDVLRGVYADTEGYGEANIFVQENANLASISFPRLFEIRGGADCGYGAFGVYNQFTRNDALVNLNLPRLTAIEPGGYSEFGVTYTENLETIDLPALITAPVMFFRGMASLTDIHLPRWAGTGEYGYASFYSANCIHDKPELRLWLCKATEIDISFSPGCDNYLGCDTSSCYRVKGHPSAEEACDADADCEVLGIKGGCN